VSVPATATCERPVTTARRGGRLRHRRKRRCNLCGCVLADDEPAGVLVCSPCRRTRRDYRPAADAAFDAELERLFRAHPGETIHLCQALGVPLCRRREVWVAVRRLRRRLTIVGIRYTGGYVYLPAEVVPPAGGRAW